MSQVLTEDTRKEMRNQASLAIPSVLWEYCPTEFLMVFNEYEMLLIAIDRLAQSYQDDITDAIAQLRTSK